MKTQIIDLLIERLQKMIGTAEADRAFHQEEAQHHVGAMDSRYDTFKEEAQYMATGQEARIASLRTDVTVLKNLRRASAAVQPGHQTVQVGSIVTVVGEQAEERTYCVLPAGGGQKLSLGGRHYTSLTPQSLFGRALRGKEEGDAFEFQAGRRVREWEVVLVD